MKKTTFSLVGCIAASSIILLAGSATAQDFFDDFESYPLGGGITETADWEMWCGSEFVDVTVTDEFAHSGVKSIRTDPGNDVVRRISATSGTWVLSVWTYVPSSSLGNTFVIGMNTYPDETCVGDNHWSLVLRLDADADIVEAEFSGAETTILMRDEWIEIKVIVDLDSDLHDIYYGDFLLVDDRIWSEAWDVGGAQEFRALDIFSNDGICYYDDVFIGKVGIEVCPDSQTILAGMQQSGGFGDVCASDDVRSVYQSTTFAAVFSPAPIQVQYDGNFAGAGAALTFNMEAHPTLGGGSAFLSVQMWNYTTGSYTSVPFINQADGTDTLYSLTVDNSGGDYVDTNGDVRALVTGAKTQDGPVRLNVDQVFWSD